MSDSPLTPDDLAAMEARCAAATPGPWAVDGTAALGAYGVVCATAAEHVASVFYLAQRLSLSNRPKRDANAAFIAASRSDLPRLLAEVRRLRAEVERLNKGATNG